MSAEPDGLEREQGRLHSEPVMRRCPQVRVDREVDGGLSPGQREPGESLDVLGTCESGEMATPIW